MQQEADLDESMLNGEKSVILVLDDVQVGDVIDYAYSIKGDNSVYGAHFSCIVPVQMEQPADRLLTRVLWPRQKPLYEKQHGCSVRPVATAGKDIDELTWDFNQVPGVTFEDSLPVWYDPEQWVEISDFASWADVNRWALQLFQITPPYSPDLSRRIAEWSQIPDREQQILTVLQFVQDQVRYFGLEIGKGTVTPTDPSVVYSRRYGDCKDKSFLFVAIMRALGFEAFPVLVNATLGRGIEDWLPTANAFDHCIAEVLYDGQTYWLDPTINYQRGSLASHYLPNYGCGLVISPMTTGLTDIPQTTGMPQTTTTEYFQVSGISEPADLKVVTVAEGRDADVMRRLFATTKLTDIESVYAHLYSAVYSGIKTSSPIEIDDNQDQNIFQTTQYYSIDNIWTDEKGKQFSIEFFPSSIQALLQKPVDTDREQPLGIDFPEHQILRTEIDLPQPWPKGASDKTIDDPAFTFRRTGRSVGNKLIVEYEYQSLADSVSPDDAGDYIQRIDQCSQLLGESVEWR